MNDHDMLEKREKRSSQEDPIIMYLIVREELGMSIGKTAAQCAHAAQMLQLQFNKLEHLESKQRLIDTDYDKIKTFKEWLDSSFRKVVLRADDKEWLKIKQDCNQYMITVIDAGLTEIPGGSETVIGLWPIRKSQVPKTIKRLQVLK